ncbi:cupin domain-containing protein [bacterium]|nr:cupin domain-containing protein [bacterium]
MLTITRPGHSELKEMKVFGWPIWEKEISEFSWHYDSREICYLLEGKVEITVGSGEVFKFGKGDLVIFPKGLSCKWKIISPVRKHYKFE